jgi:hypothetical protein
MWRLPDRDSLQAHIDALKLCLEVVGRERLAIFVPGRLSGDEDQSAAADGDRACV